MGAPVVHFEINGRDSKRIQEYYASLFGWQINANNPISYGLVNTGVKKGINGGIGQVDGGQSPFVTFYVEVGDPRAYLDNALTCTGLQFVELGTLGADVTAVSSFPTAFAAQPRS